MPACLASSPAFRVLWGVIFLGESSSAGILARYWIMLASVVLAIGVGIGVGFKARRHGGALEPNRRPLLEQPPEKRRTRKLRREATDQNSPRSLGTYG
ncbi:MAG: hypothetical protein JOZ19_00390 [Rubrobacter sp.]|nr:hypothetical protein [Rubrobacter sp.]